MVGSSSSSFFLLLSFFFFFNVFFFLCCLLALGERGIFRKAGSESRTQALRDSLSKTSNRVDFAPYKSHDVSSLVKRYLRELPEPLLTFQLHELFLVSQKFPEPEVQCEVIHLAVLLLPKCNRDLLEVLSTFFRKLADNAGGPVDQEEGNLMTSRNLATVFAPTVLYPEKDREKQKEVIAGPVRRASIPLLINRSGSQNNLKQMAENEFENDRAVGVLCSLIDNAYAFSKVPSLIVTQLSKPQLSKPQQFGASSK